MKNNGYTNQKRVTEINKLQNPSALKSLRSIINQSKIPLSDYMNNKKGSIQKKTVNIQVKRNRIKTSYFEKLKGMIGTGVQTQHSHLTPNKISLKDTENMEELNILEENKNIINVNHGQIFRRTVDCSKSVQRNRSKSNNQKTDQYLRKFNERLSFKSTKFVGNQHKTEQRIGVPKQNYKMASKYFKTINQIKNMQIQRKPLYSNVQRNDTSRSTVGKQIFAMQSQDLELEQGKSQIKGAVQKNEIVHSILSHRRLNFQKQQERRKQTIIYGKFFQKICHNIHCNQVQYIESNPIEIGQVLGNGAYSYVKEGTLRSSSLNKPSCQNEHKLAIKIYEKYKLIQPGRKSRVMKEIQILSSLDHPNIIKLFCAYQNKRQIHILFQQIEESITLQEYFKHKSLKFNRIQDFIFIVREVISGLEFLHSLGVAHRDIKPDNILISFKGDKPTVKIIDFGFATNSVISNIYCGTPNFMAPQLFRKQPYSPQMADLWALGVTLYYLLESKYPFKGYNEKDLIRIVCQNKFKFQKTPPCLQYVISMLLQENPEARITVKGVLSLITQL